MKRITRLAIVGLVLAAASIAAPQRGTFFVDMNDANVFSPQTIEVEPGSVIVWQNRGFRFHAVQSDDPSFGINSDWVFPLGYGYSYHFWWQVPYFAQSGTVIYYHCRFHGMPGNGLDYGRGMVGRIVVL